jgi:hypothetical protein
VATLVGCGLMSCTDMTEAEPVDGAMHASIVGSADPWDAERSLTATMINGNLVVKGVEQSRASVTLTVYNAAVGSFDALGGEQAPRVEATYGDDRTFSYSSVLVGGTANVTITELSATKVVGTFMFLSMPVIPDPLLTASYRVVNGTFSVKIR